MYVSLLKECLLDNIYGSHIMEIGREEDIGKKGQLADTTIIDNGEYFPMRAHTMMGRKRLDNIHYCIENIKTDNIEGDFIETGVWRGGGTILMAGLNKYYQLNKKTYVADSFKGLPPPNELYPQDVTSTLHEWDILRVSVDDVKSNFDKYNLLDENVCFIEGFFENSLKTANINKLSLLRLDGDMYSSTIVCLEELYDKLSIGGYIIIDDYGCKAVECKAAVDDFRQTRNIQTMMIPIDWTGVYWKKE